MKKKSYSKIHSFLLDIMDDQDLPKFIGPKIDLGLNWAKTLERKGLIYNHEAQEQGRSQTFQSEGLRSERGGGLLGLKMADLHRPLYKV